MESNKNLSLLAIVISIIAIAISLTFSSSLMKQKQQVVYPGQAQNPTILHGQNNAAIYADWNDNDPNVCQPYGSYCPDKKFFVPTFHIPAADPNTTFKVDDEGRLRFKTNPFSTNNGAPFNHAITPVFATQPFLAPNDGTSVGYSGKYSMNGFGSFNTNDPRNLWYGSAIGLVDTGAFGFPTFISLSHIMVPDSKNAQGKCIVNYSRFPVPGVVPAGEGFIYFINVNTSACDARHNLTEYKVTYNRAGHSARWFVGGQQIFEVNNVGKELPASYNQYDYTSSFLGASVNPALTHIVDVAGFFAGFGNCNFQDLYNEKVLGMNNVDANKDENWLFGQGFELTVDDYRIGAF